MKESVLTKERPSLEITSVRDHFNGIAKDYDYWKEKNAYYYEGLKSLFRSVVPPGAKVLEVGCGTGEILHTVCPGEGLGIDLSSDMVEIARRKYPSLSFEVGNIETFHFKTTYDYVIMSDLVDHLPDIWKALRGLEGALRDGTTLVISTVNPIWDPILLLGERMRMKMPEGPHNFVPVADLAALLALFDYEVREVGYRMPCPIDLPVLAHFFNQRIPNLPLLRCLGVVQYLVVVKRKKECTSAKSASTVSVVIPYRDEIAEIRECVRGIPPMGSRTEILVVPYGSGNGFPEKIRDLEVEYPHLRVETSRVHRTRGEAVRHGFEAASGEILMVLDAKSLQPEELYKFFWVLEKRTETFVNGTRMVYPREGESLRTLHLIGNKLFGVLFSRLLGQRVTDTLCGSKALRKKDYIKLKTFPCVKPDSLGDFDLLFRASEGHLKIVEIPVSYKGLCRGRLRRAFRNGITLFVMVFVGWMRLRLTHVRHLRQS